MKYIESVSDKAISPLQSLDDNLGSTVNYFVLPIFAFANAGISFDGFSFSTIGSVSLAVFLGLVIGKSMGIFLFTWTAISSKLFKMPKYLNYKLLFGVSILGGIGFTVSLFIASLAYGGTEPQLLNDAKMGIIFGSLFAGVSGFLYLKKALST